VLAAGRGSRLGGSTPKPLLELRGRPLVAWALDAAQASGCAPVVLVVGHRAGKVAAVAPQGVLVTPARRWKRGIARSLRAALAELDGYAQVQAVCIGLADQPLVGPDAYRRLAAAHGDGAELAVATYGGERGNPVVLARTLWPAAMKLDGDEGARVLMRAHPPVEVPCDGTGDPSDVDTLDDLRRLEQETGKS
jgi:molybdenum cofactor cytidylyltransferase